MGLVRFSIIVFLGATASVDARPLVVSSDETYPRLCLAQQIDPARLVDACDTALSEPGLTRAQRVALLVSRADGFLWLNDHSAAEAGYRAAIAVDPYASDAWNGLGWVLRETGDEAAAYSAFETSLASEVTAQGLSGKAVSGRNIGVLTGDASRTMLRSALAINPDYVWALREIGWSFVADGQPEAAVAAFEESLVKEPGDANAGYGLGRAVLATGDAERALGIFNDIVEQGSDTFAARVYRVVALRELDLNAQALRDSDRLIADYPGRTSGYIERALTLQALDRRAEAIETYERAEAVLGPDNAILYWHADALATDGRFGDALKVIDRGLSLSGADYSDHLLKSYIALEMGDYPTVRAAAEASLKTGVEDPWAHYYIAISLVHLGQASEGLSRFQRAIQTGLPVENVGDFARELINAGKYAEAEQLRTMY